MTRIQISSGSVYRMKKHKLAGKAINTAWGPGKVLGIRADARSARESNAFIVQLGNLKGSVYLMSRINFSLISTK